MHNEKTTASIKRALEIQASDSEDSVGLPGDDTTLGNSREEQIGNEIMSKARNSGGSSDDEEEDNTESGEQETTGLGSAETKEIPVNGKNYEERLADLVGIPFNPGSVLSQAMKSSDLQSRRNCGYSATKVETLAAAVRSLCTRVHSLVTGITSDHKCIALQSILNTHPCRCSLCVAH